MGVVVRLSNDRFIFKFRSWYKRAESKTEYLELLKWVISYYADPETEKEHQLLAVLSVVYLACPESFFDYVKDFEAQEREFMVTAKVMFEEGYIENDLINKWQFEVLGRTGPYRLSRLEI